ncbi:MAG: ECF-type sigma factor [Gemmataceae bacterium]|nr:ECF-type sigma factor [Gemmataceae bacterium]
MPPPGSVSHWIVALKEGDQLAAQRLWERYHLRLLGLARQLLQGARRRAADEEDVVQNAFHSFFEGVSQGRFPQLQDRDNLWRLLVVITARKAINQVRNDRRHGGGGVTLPAQATISPVETDDDALADMVGSEPSPELAAQVVEQYERLLKQLDDDKLRQIAVWKLEGCTNGEIARKLGCTRRTVIRKLETIRLIWTKASP